MKMLKQHFYDQILIQMCVVGLFGNHYRCMIILLKMKSCLNIPRKDARKKDGREIRYFDILRKLNDFLNYCLVFINFKTLN